MSPVVYLALGTNLGDRMANLRAALSALPPEVNVLVCSPVYETPPWGYPHQPAFLNQVVKAETNLPPLELLAFLKGIEAQMGRQATFRDGPRVIDLDILFYNDLVHETPALSIPHPRMAGRAFVLIPLADLAPSLSHPVLGLKIQEMLADVDRTGITQLPVETC